MLVISSDANDDDDDEGKKKKKRLRRRRSLFVYVVEYHQKLKAMEHKVAACNTNPEKTIIQLMMMMMLEIVENGRS
uniref:HMG box domain-containing protein n=1 Tax=Syphacia muris TaxID=451379 RepID=A0A0N5APW6_9BILA